MALGAARAQILRDSLAESLLLGAAGGSVALAFAYAGLRLLRFMEPGSLPRLDEISIDLPVMLFALAASLFSCLLFGLLPALKYTGSALAPALRLGRRFAGTSRERHRAQDVLLVGQISLALVLVVTSGLMLRTFQEIRKARPGFTSPRQVQVFGLAIPKSQVEQPERVVRMWNDILERLAAIPGVSAAGLANSLPMDDTKNQNPVVAESPRDERGIDPPIRTFKFVSPGFLAATGTRVIAGRDLAWDDIYGRRPVALISENLARKLWGSSLGAVGKRIHKMSNNIQWCEVVGVVEDVHDDGIQREAPPIVYWPFAEANFNGAPLSVQRDAAFAVRSPGAGTEAFVKQIRHAVAAINPTAPVVRAGTLDEIYRGSMAQTSFTLVMLAIAGGMALVLGVVGVYGVIAYTVEQRRREVGIRMALGAPPAAVKRMFLRRGLLMACVGITLGLAAAAACSRLMSSLLFGVTPLDPATYGATATILLAAAMAATYIPACRAAAVDPMETLRGE